MTSQSEAYARFRALHERPSIFVMPNVWDGASAVLLKRAGFEALATSSAAIAFGWGRQDCAHAVSRAEAVGNGTLIGSLTGLPVNGDLEDGFGPSPDDCVATVEAAIASGLAGLGIEDSTADPARPIHDFDDAVARIRAAAQAAKGRILLTGRTDNYLHKRPDLDDTIRRLVAFAEAGADVLFAPGAARYGCDPRGGARGCAQAGQCRGGAGERAGTAGDAGRGRRPAGERRGVALQSCDDGNGGGRSRAGGRGYRVGRGRDEEPGDQRAATGVIAVRS
jgi:hypothetical protein